MGRAQKERERKVRGKERDVHKQSQLILCLSLNFLISYAKKLMQRLQNFGGARRRREEEYIGFTGKKWDMLKVKGE